jgi:uncharacterized protein YqjF (DUF2071 family)
MLNFEIAPETIEPFVPRGVELDYVNGTTFVSLVGFQFLRTNVLGVPVPFHRNFSEINLRLYVRRQAEGGWRQGVVFVKEIVPRRLVSLVARVAYNENYVTRKMRGTLIEPTPQSIGRVGYAWKKNGRWNRFAATIAGEPLAAKPGSEEAFISEHYWGYTQQRDGGTVEYEVEHAPWRVWPAHELEYDCDVKAEYGADFADLLAGKPSSAFVADGSAVVVRRGRRID